MVIVINSVDNHLRNSVLFTCQCLLVSRNYRNENKTTINQNMSENQASSW